MWPKVQLPRPHLQQYPGAAFTWEVKLGKTERQNPGSVTKGGAVLILVCAGQQAANIQHRQGGASPRERRVVGSHRRGGALPEGSSHTQRGQQPQDSWQFLFPESEPQQPYAHTRAPGSICSKNLTLANSGTNWTLSAQAP